jgi:hypothetical protein
MPANDACFEESGGGAVLHIDWLREGVAEWRSGGLTI